MMRRYVLAPQAAEDLVEIWRHLASEANAETAERVETEIRKKIEFLARTPGAGHWRKDLTDDPVKFFAVYSYLIIYRPESKPLHVIAILHGRRNVTYLLKDRD